MIQVLLKMFPVEAIVLFVVQKLAPNAPSWVAGTLSRVATAVAKIVENLNAGEVAELEPADKMRRAVAASRKVLDQAFDEIPAWKEMSEARRDRILAGAAELVLFTLELAASDKKVSRKALRKLR